MLGYRGASKGMNRTDLAKLIYPVQGRERGQPPHGGYSPEIWVGVCGPPLESLTLFQTKICDFPYPISDLTQNYIPYFRPDPYSTSFA